MKVDVSRRGVLARLLEYPSLVERIGRAYDPNIVSPARLVLDRPGSMLLVMAAAREHGLAVVKTVTVGPDLRSHVRVTGPDGAEIAILHGETLTARRTAALSVCAAAQLARPEADALAVLGAGPQAAALARAYVACRSIRRLTVWARRPDAARTFAVELARDTGAIVSIAASAAAAVRVSDIVTAATRTVEPLIRNEDVRPGTHLDLVGGFRPTMREADDALIARAAIVVADSAQAPAEAGDLLLPIAAGVIGRDRVRLLADILAHGVERRPGDVTVFKSVGFAALDLVAAELALERAGLPSSNAARLPTKAAVKEAIA